MKKLLLFTIALVMLCVAPVQAANVNAVKAAIVKHSIEMGVDPAITLSIAKTESNFRQELKSPRGAVGVFQLMPSTARRMGLNPYLLDDNIKGGVMYYKSMYKMFGSVELALAAYNAGPGNVKKYHAVPPYRETKKYVSSIMTDYANFKKHPDSTMLAAKKTTTVAVKPNANKKAQILAGQTNKLPITKIEQSRSINSSVVHEIPAEVNVKSQSVAI